MYWKEWLWFFAQIILIFVLLLITFDVYGIGSALGVWR